jgi:hypothetical protein
MENKKKKKARKNGDRDSSVPIPIHNERSYTRKIEHKRNSDEMDDYDNFRIESFQNTDNGDYDNRNTENIHDQYQDQDQDQYQYQDSPEQDTQGQDTQEQYEESPQPQPQPQQPQYHHHNREKDQKVFQDRYNNNNSSTNIRPIPIASSSLSTSSFSTNFTKHDDPKYVMTDEKTKLFEKISYMTHLLESQQHEKTSNIMEEFVLYLLLGTFMIFTIDTFVRYRIIR